jgi:hypothetical protein
MIISLSVGKDVKREKRHRINTKGKTSLCISRGSEVVGKAFCQQRPPWVARDFWLYVNDPDDDSISVTGTRAACRQLELPEDAWLFRLMLMRLQQNAGYEDSSQLLTEDAALRRA